jgi:hypothetical protein
MSQVLGQAAAAAVSAGACRGGRQALPAAALELLLAPLLPLLLLPSCHSMDRVAELRWPHSPLPRLARASRPTTAIVAAAATPRRSRGTHEEGISANLVTGVWRARF